MWKPPVSFSAWAKLGSNVPLIYGAEELPFTSDQLESSSGMKNTVFNFPIVPGGIVPVGGVAVGWIELVVGTRTKIYIEYADPWVDEAAERLSVPVGMDLL